MGKATPGLVTGDDGTVRCWWSDGSPEYRVYHDGEWGRPVLDDQRLFEKISLEGFQAGLSWLIVLRKREGLRKAFDGFDFRRLARSPRSRAEGLLKAPVMIRNRAKVVSVLNNARRACELVEEAGSLASFLWRFEPRPAARPRRLTQAVLKGLTTCPEAGALSKELKRRRWTFVGPTTLYAFMQGVGLVNDHLEGCPVRPQVERIRARLKRP
ncbi:MAG TPA: DNA-3-methyladenine glycosylase I [Vicinamibacteria bacterium]|nr:DNA-3-methyladenine glycosylase I [Vicinamibacteria bacterium]